MSNFSRADRSVLGLWWWTVDRWTLAALAALIFIGALAGAGRQPGGGAAPEARQLLSRAPPFRAAGAGPADHARGLPLRRRWASGALAMIGLLIALALTAVTLFAGQEIKGARRWVDLAGLSLQPSEFLKPCFAVTTAWLFAEQHGQRRAARQYHRRPALSRASSRLLMSQPDFGMTFVISVTWFAQFVLAGLPLLWVGAFALVGAGGVVGAYYLFPHVATRIDGFLDPATGDSYQVDRALEAFVNGGLWGRGPGEGTVKQVLPDAHSDFVFAVAGEEFGLIACLLIVALFSLRRAARLWPAVQGDEPLRRCWRPRG